MFRNLQHRLATTTKTLLERLHEAGCVSTRVRVLANKYTIKMTPLVSRIERLAKNAHGDNKKEDAFDAICQSWYLSDINDDAEAMKQLRSDIIRLEEQFKK